MIKFLLLQISILIIFSLKLEKNYETYVLSLQYVNNVCETSSNSSECYKLLNNTPKNIFTIHGLWPGKKTGQSLEECSKSEEIINITDSDLYNNLIKFWPSTNINKPNENFWSHEYFKHGFCYTEKYNLKMEDYFKKTIEIYHQFNFETFIINSFLGINDNNIYISLGEFEKIIQAFYPGFFYKINCSKNKNSIYLTEIHFYFDLNFNPIKVNFSKDTNCPKNKDDLFIIKLR